MAQVKSRNFSQHTTETVLRSNGALTLDDVFPSSGAGPYSSSDIYNAQPALGFYCLCSKRTSNDTLPDCPSRHIVAQAHAKMLTEAGFDYVAIDITNWPQINAATDVAVIRPLENLFDMWLDLRSRSIATPSIVMWCDSPVATYPDGQETTWQHLLTHFYNNATRSPLIWQVSTDDNDDDNYDDNTTTTNTKKMFMLPDNSNFQQNVSALIQKNGGRNDVSVVKVWALFGRSKYEAGSWGFFSPCTTANGGYTTSMVGVGECNQYSSNATTTTRTPPPVAASPSGQDEQVMEVVEVSASGGYMLSQCALPFASTGHMRGLTLQRLFRKVLATGAPNLFMSSFNEFIGGRQEAVYHSNVAFNMGLPNDAQRGNVWVDTYGVEFSRDIEPSVEGGSVVWDVAKDCVQMYKKGETCDGASANSTNSRPCCSTWDKEVWHNAWSLKTNDSSGENGSGGNGSGGNGSGGNHSGGNGSSGSDFLVTNSESEKEALVQGGAWMEVCHSINGPTVFCVDTTIQDGRDGPFMLYSRGDVELQSGDLRAVHRCYSNVTGTHWLSSSSSCAERAGGHAEFVLGWAAGRRGGGTLRELFRCESLLRWSHALDIGCVNGTTKETSLGFVR